MVTTETIGISLRRASSLSWSNQTTLPLALYLLRLIPTRYAFLFVILAAFTDCTAFEFTDPLPPFTQVSINSGARPINSSLAWADGEYGIAWENEYNCDGVYDCYNLGINFRRISADGALPGPEIPIVPSDSRDFYDPSLAWTGNGYGLACDDAYGLYFQLISLDGDLISPLIPVTSWDNFTASNHPSLVWAGAEFGVAWEARPSGFVDPFYTDICFQRIAANAELVESTVCITNDGDSVNPSLVWTGSGFGVSWDGGYESGVYLQRLSPTGTILGSAVCVTANGEPASSSLIWAGNRYEISWDTYYSDYPDGNYRIRGRSISPNGEPGRFRNVFISDGWSDTANLVNHSLVWTGNEVGASWYYQSYMNGSVGNIYFAHFADED